MFVSLACIDRFLTSQADKATPLEVDTWIRSSSSSRSVGAPVFDNWTLQINVRSMSPVHRNLPLPQNRCIPGTDNGESVLLPRLEELPAHGRK